MCRLKNWVDDWDRKISRYIHSYGEIYKCETEPILEAYNGGVIEESLLIKDIEQDKKLKLYGLPEPYVGDPLSNKLSAVFLTLNPAGPIRSQCKLPQYTGDSIVQKVWFHASYYSIFKKLKELPKDTQNWWNVYLQWAKSILITSKEISEDDRSIDLSSIVGIDLCPWHSTDWGGIKIDSQTANWINENSIQPAAFIAKKSKFPYILAVGKQWYDVLLQLGFETVTLVTNQSCLDRWPLNTKRKKVNRTFALMANKKLNCEVFLTWAPGSNKPPAKHFDHIQAKCISLNILPKIA